MPSNNRRNFGLDVLRAAAIMMVLLSHMAGALNLFGIYGVELFFVLSGFLIGDILIQTAARLNRFAFEDLTEFWKRRWFRTLPNYYLFLVLYLVEWFARYSADGAAPTDVYLYPFFLQNFAWPFVNEEGRYFFSPTWSLAIEEWFYLLFPGAFFLLATQLKSPDATFRQFFYAMLLFLLIPPALRFLAAWFDPSVPAGFTVVFRLDAIMYGVMLAYLKTWHVSIWAWLRKAWPLGIVGLLGGALLIKGVLIDPRFFTAQALIFSVLPLSFALILPVCENLSQRTGWSACVIQRISVWSYSMYLAHMLVYDETRAFLNYDQSSDAGRVLIKLLALTLIFAVSALNYRYFERPLTNLREHFGGKKQRYCAVSRSAHTHPPS